ncbi:MAG: purine-nucleoside phosphorylase [Bdellovibrionales bacterium]
MTTPGYFEAAQHLQKHYRRLGVNTPTFHLVLGSAIGQALDGVVQNLGRAPIAGLTLSAKWEKVSDISFNDIPGLPKATVAGHKGTFSIFRNLTNNQSVVFQVGRIHGYEGHSAQLTVLPVLASCFAGTKKFVLTNAAGSLNKNMLAGHIMVIKDHVNLTGQNPLVGENGKDPSGKEWGPRFPDMSETYNRELSKKLQASFTETKATTHQGTYLGLLGPNYETPAEVQLFHRWGLDVVGMSTVWEALALKHAGATLVGASLITNMACGLMGEEILDHEDMLDQTKYTAEKVIGGLFRFLETA